MKAIPLNILTGKLWHISFAKLNLHTNSKCRINMFSTRQNKIHMHVHAYMHTHTNNLGHLCTEVHDASSLCSQGYTLHYHLFYVHKSMDVYFALSQSHTLSL